MSDTSRNCAHRLDGWCLSCVSDFRDDNQSLRIQLTARTQEVERLREELKKYRNPLEVLGDQRVTVGLGPDGPFVSEVKSTKGET